MAIEVRAASTADLPGLGRLLVTQLREHGVELPEAEITGGAAGMLRRPQRGRFVVAVEDDALLGFAALSFLWTLEHGGWAAWLDELYVLPERRGQGLGQRLLDAALAAAVAAGARALDLEIEAGHERVESLYARNAFTRLARSRWSRALVRPAPPRAPRPVDSAGGCLCGAVRYRAAGVAREVSHCHCGICRRASGAPFVTWLTLPAAGFAFTSGSPALLRATPRAERHHCAACGTPLTFRELAAPEWIDVTVGSLDDADTLEPDRHIWTANQVRWLHLDDDLPRFPERSD